MLRSSLLLFAILPLLKACLTLPALADEPAAPRYAITDLGTLGGTTSIALGINDSGQVVGGAQTSHGVMHAFLWERGKMKDLSFAGTGAISIARAISRLGQVVGESSVADSPMHAFFWERGRAHDLGTLGSHNGAVNAINDDGQVVGRFDTPSGERHAFRWAAGPFQASDSLGGNLISARAINNRSQIVGTMELGHGDNINDHGFLWDSRRVTDLGTFVPHGIGGGLAVGEVSGGAAIWQDGQTTRLPSLKAVRSIANCINNLRQIIDSGDIPNFGSGTSVTNPHALCWADGQCVDLNERIAVDAGWVLEDAEYINNHGQIVGQGEHHGERHAFLMTPVGAPPPAPAPPPGARQAVGTTSPSTSTEAVGSPSVPAPSKVDASFILDKPTLVLGEPVWVTFRFTNRSTGPLRFMEATNRGSVLDNEYEFIAYDAGGHEASPPHSRFGIINGFVHEVTVAPGESFQQHLFLPDWFTLHQPGTYSLTCKRTLNVTRLSPKSEPLESPVSVSADHEDIPVVARLPLRILPPDAASLGVVIRKLGENTLGREGIIKNEAAMSLSVIPDLRIVPILARILAHTAPSSGYDSEENFHAENSKFFAIAGLSHFPCDTSAKALLPMLNQNDEDLRRAAASALQEMKYADRVLPQLRRELKSPTASTRVVAIHAIGATQDLRAFAPLVNALQDREAIVRYEAAKALGTLGDRKAVPILKSHFQDRDMTMRLACIKGLVPLKYPILTQWLTPIVRSYAFPAHEYPSLEAMTVIRLDCGDRAARALASCLQFDDPRPSNGFNFFLIYNLEACPGGPKYYDKWMNGDDSQTAVENNRKILASIKAWLQGLRGPRLDQQLNASSQAPISKRPSAVPPQSTALQSELLAMTKQD